MDGKEHFISNHISKKINIARESRHENMALATIRKEYIYTYTYIFVYVRRWTITFESVYIKHSC